MESDKKQVKTKKMQGVISSDKMDKTVVVSVTNFRTNKKYRKQYSIQRRFKAHDEKNEYKEGDKVIIAATRPYSKEKRWEVVELLERADNKDKEIQKEE
jgi:small subunit ribosomal protein S17